MYKAIIIEDEYHLRESLTILLEIVAPNTIQVVGFAEDTETAVKIIDQLQPDLVFMDIMLRRGTGFDVLSQISYKSFHLIFTTAYEQHAIRAFKFNAIDYLLKPIDADELRLSIQRIADQQQLFIQGQQLHNFRLDTQSMPESIILPTQEAMHVVKVKHIVRCETSGSYTTFVLHNSKNIIVSKPLKHYEEILCPPHFYRIHQSHLINTKYVTSYSKEGLISLQDGSTVPVSRANKEAFFKLMRDNNR
jgi:Response regulator of the LytR/AlgR family